MTRRRLHCRSVEGDNEGTSVAVNQGIEMSRAYRITVKDTVRKVIRAQDHVRSQLDMLDILPVDQMADLLAEELLRKGFVRDGEAVVRSDGETKIIIDLRSGTVTVTSESAREVRLSGERSGRTYDDQGPTAIKVKENLQEDLAKDLQESLSDQEKVLQRQVTDKLESQLADLRKELDQAVNRATAEALKQKASQLGQIKQMTEDPETGSLTIVVEV